MTTTVPLIGITGSTGQLGGRVATRLATLGQPQRLLARNPTRAPQLPGAEIVQASYEDEITGAQAFTLIEAAEEFSRATGLPYSYQPETIEEARASRGKFNPTDWELEAWVSTYVAIATGEMSVVSHTVETLTGHAPQTLADYVHKHPESYKHITATPL